MMAGELRCSPATKHEGSSQQVQARDIALDLVSILFVVSLQAVHLGGPSKQRL